MQPMKLYKGKGPVQKERFIDIVDNGTSIDIRLVDENGFNIPSCKLLRIHKQDGSIYRYNGISKDQGLALTSDGRLKTN